MLQLYTHSSYVYPVPRTVPGMYSGVRFWFLFLPSTRYYCLRLTYEYVLLQLPPFRNSDPGSHSRHSSPLPATFTCCDFSSVFDHLFVRAPYAQTIRVRRSTEEGHPDTQQSSSFGRDPCSVSRVACAQSFFGGSGYHDLCPGFLCKVLVCSLSFFK